MSETAMTGEIEALVARLLDADQNSQQRIMGSRIFAEAAETITRLNHECAAERAESDQSDRMVKISALIANLATVRDRYGDTCVYIRRGGMSWGAVALNREADDKKHGVFDLQAQHDRDMQAMADRVERLTQDRRAAEARALTAEAALAKAVEDEREACARIAEDPANGLSAWRTRERIAAAIRDRANGESL